MVKNLPANTGDERQENLNSGSERSPGVGNGKALQYSYLENSIDSGFWRATDPGVPNSQTELSICRHSRINAMFN